MGITTALGRDWEPWMVLRELGCNALDEGGAFGTVASGFSTTGLRKNETTIAVEWDALETAYSKRKELFLEGEPLWTSSHLRILTGPSEHIFYRGVRVYKLEKQSKFTFDILDEQRLTEDRTLTGTYAFDGLLRDALMTMQEKSIIFQALTAGDGFHESKIDFENASWGVKPSRPFLDAAVEARSSDKLANDSARKVLLRHIRSSTEETSAFGSYSRFRDDALAYAIEQLGTVGIKFSAGFPFVVLDEMPGPDTLSILEDGRIYLLRDLLKKGARAIAVELIARWVDLKNDSYDSEGVVKLLTPIILGRLGTMKMDEYLVKEDEAEEEMPLPVLHAAGGGAIDIPF